MDGDARGWIRMDPSEQDGPGWVKVDGDGPGWVKVDEDGPGWTGMDHDVCDR